MQGNLDYEIHPKEQTYFAIKIIAATIGYLLILFAMAAMFISPDPLPGLLLIFYGLLFVTVIFFQYGLLIGYLKGNAVRVTPKQFPLIQDIVNRQSRALGLANVPEVYVLQSGGLLNAFATRFLGANYIVIYSEIMEEVFENNLETVEFVIGHELGHLKRRHLTKSLWLFPSFIVPFLNSAYSRACEHTCDNIGAALSPNGVRNGLLLLASGKKLWNKMNAEAFAEQERTEYGFWFWFAEKVSSHPRLTRRISRFKAPARRSASAPVFAEPSALAPEKPAGNDHSAFLPK